MRILRSALSAAAALFLLAACDGGTGSTPVDTVIIEADDSELAVGGTLQLTATAYDDDGNVITGRDVDWSVSNNTIASINGAGVLTGLKPGDVTVTAEIGGKRDQQVFEVIDPFGGCAVVVHTLGSTTNGTLSTSDCDLEDGTYADFYQVTVPTRRQVTITMRSSAVDSYLLLVSPNFQLLAEDDDSAGGNDARITTTLDAGTYTIVANSYFVQTGAYTLTTQ